MGLAASHPHSEGVVPPAYNPQRQPPHLASAASNRSRSPVSRTGTPGLNGHPSNIAPQHMFDGVTLDGQTFHSPSLTSFNLRQPSPGSLSVLNGALEPTLSPDSLVAANTALKTRVSELEVINDLFRGRVAELEASEQEARRGEMVARDGESRALMREAELRRRLDELEAQLSELGGPARKRLRMEDMVQEDGVATPLSSPSDGV